MKIYDDPEYAATRLNETLVRLDGKAFFVENVLADGVVHGYHYNPITRRVCSLEELDITPVQLGYVNNDGETVYVVRAPMREDWRQGLRQNSLRFTDGRRADWVDFGKIALTVENRFPTLVQAVRDVKRVFRVAFCRSFAITVDSLVYYKEEVVGNIDLETATITLLPHFEWLNETLEEEKMNAR